ncbi:MAG: hypothetical protein WDZ59_11815 [Pirellulales bacterium]
MDDEQFTANQKARRDNDEMMGQIIRQAQDMRLDLLRTAKRVDGFAYEDIDAETFADLQSVVVSILQSNARFCLEMSLSLRGMTANNTKVYDLLDMAVQRLRLYEE